MKANVSSQQDKSEYDFSEDKPGRKIIIKGYDEVVSKSK